MNNLDITPRYIREKRLKNKLNMVKYNECQLGVAATLFVVKVYVTYFQRGNFATVGHFKVLMTRNVFFQNYIILCLVIIKCNLFFKNKIIKGAFYRLKT